MGCHACERVGCWSSCHSCPRQISYAHLAASVLVDVSSALREYTRKELNCHIRSRDVGGGGDCLFHSFVAVLAKMLTSNADASQHVLSRLSCEADLQHFANKPCIVQHLRQVSARAFESWAPEAVFDLILAAAVRQRFGAFEDDWDPEDLLVSTGFPCLRNEDNALAESVLAFERQLNDDAILRVAFTGSTGLREERLVTVPHGSIKFHTMRATLQEYFAEIGNFHWGTQTDVQSLSEAFDVGIFMFCDSLQGNGSQSMYNIGARRDDFAYWVALWWEEPVHFRLAEVSEQGHGYASFWKAEEVPARLLSEYRRCNRLAN